MLQTLILVYNWTKCHKTSFTIKYWKSHVIYWILYWKWKQNGYRCIGCLPCREKLWVSGYLCTVPQEYRTASPGQGVGVGVEIKMWSTVSTEGVSLLNHHNVKKNHKIIHPKSRTVCTKYLLQPVTLAIQNTTIQT